MERGKSDINVNIKGSRITGQTAIGNDNDQNQVGNVTAENGGEPDGGIPWVAIGAVAGIVAAIAAVIALFLL